MRIHGVEFEAGWKHDIQDKDDFDFPVLSVSTRYWGRDNTAKPTIYLGDEKLVECGYYIEGETESETKSLTEKWIKENLELIIKRIKG